MLFRLLQPVNSSGAEPGRSLEASLPLLSMFDEMLRHLYLLTFSRAKALTLRQLAVIILAFWRLTVLLATPMLVLTKGGDRARTSKTYP